jgi:hypothetical protein
MMIGIIPAPGWYCVTVDPREGITRREPLVGFGLTSKGEMVGLIAGEGGKVVPATDVASVVSLWHPQQGVPHEAPKEKPRFKNWRAE